MAKQKKTPPNQIAENRKARHDYHLHQTFEAGVVLEGWEIKSIRAGRAQLKDSYVIFRQGEPWLLNCHISPLPTASAHLAADATRTRKLLLNHKELKTLIGATSQKGFTIVPVNLHWARQWVKLTIALAKGKKLHDKRQSQKERDLKREAARGD